MTKLLLSFLVESDKTFTFFLDGKRQPLLSPLHQGFLLPGSMVMIPSFFKEFGEPPYQRPHCPPHLLYCILSILTPPSSVRLFIKIGPWSPFFNGEGLIQARPTSMISFSEYILLFASGYFRHLLGQCSHI